MLLVILGIVWVAVLAWWLSTRTNSGNALGGVADRLSSLERAIGGSGRQQARKGAVVPFKNLPSAVQGGNLGQPVGGRPMGGGRGPVVLGGGRGLTSAQARVRRRNVLFGLAGLAALTLLMGLTAGGRLMTVHYVVDVLLVGYLGLVLAYQRETEAMKATPLRVHPKILHDDNLIIEPEPVLSWDDPVYPDTYAEPVAVPLAATGTDGASFPSNTVFADEGDIWSVGGGGSSGGYAGAH